MFTRLSSAMVLLRCLMALTFVCAVNAQTVSDKSLIDIFKKPQGSCNKLEGDLDNCHECYECNHTAVVNYLAAKPQPPKQIKLTYPGANKDCVTEVFCCLPQDVLTTRIGEGCGKMIPDGAPPRRKRLGPKELLVGEYPWIAHLFKRVSNNAVKYVCGATLANANDGILLTPARCVQGIPDSSLHVSFSKDPGQHEIMAVKRVIIHENYADNTAQRHNDIALLQLTTPSNMPVWAAPACVAEARPRLATSNCFTIAERQYLINTVIPTREDCGEISDSQICSVSAPGDYSPTLGSGLFCESEDKMPIFTLHGLYSGDSKGELTKYVDVDHFKHWIEHSIRSL